MTAYVEQLYREITGQQPPKPFEQKTPEEQEEGWRQFIASVEEANLSDEQVDEFFRHTRLEPSLQIPDFTEEDAETA